MGKIFEHFSNPGFFKPLTSIHRQVYCDAMDALLHASSEASPLYDGDARRVIEDVLAESDSFEIDESEEEGPFTVYTIYNKLRECGWLDDSYIGLAGRAEVILNSDAVSLMAFLHDTARGTSGIRESDIHAISAAASRLASGDGRPVQDIFPEIERRIQSLTNALVTLKVSVRKKTSDFIQQRPLKDVVEFFTDREVDALFEDYQYLRENGYGLQFFSETKACFDEFELDDARMEEAVSEYARLNGVDAGEAREAIENKLREFGRFVLHDYRRLTGEIDRRINDCNGAITEQLMLSRRFGRDFHDLLVEYMDILKGLGDEEKEASLSGLAEELPLYSMEFVSASSLEPRVVARNKEESVSFVEDTSISDEDLAAKAKVIAEDGESRIRKAKEFIEGGLKGRSRFKPGRETVKTWADATIIADIIPVSGKESSSFPYQCHLVKGLSQETRTDIG